MNSNVIIPKRRIKLQTRVAVAIVLLSVLVSALTLTGNFIIFRNELRDSLRQRLVNIVTIAALQQDGDKFPTIQSAEDPEYERVWLQNTSILESDPDLVFVYTMRYDDDGLYFVVDAGDPTGEGFSSYGTRYYEPGPVLSENYLWLNNPMSEETFYEDEYGRFLSAYAPIRDSSDNVTGIIAVDIDASNIITSERQLLLISLGIFIAIVPIIALLGWFLGRNLAGPIQVLTITASRITQGELSYRPPIRYSRFTNTFVPEIYQLSQSFFSMSDQQRDLIENLEKRVEDRTTDLRLASEQVQKRASQLETIAEVAHSVSLIQDIDQLLNSIVRIIAERFEFYHIGIFLLDPTKEFAVLKATSSLGGQEMLKRGHKLKVGEVGIVGFVAGASKPRIALDVGQDAIYFNNPDLPETRSEMALPLVVRGIVIGVLDIQSKQTSAFHHEDIRVFHILADQVAVAIENARLFSETTSALAALEKSYLNTVRSGWSRLSQKKDMAAVCYSASENRIFEDYPQYPELHQVLESGKVITETEKISKIALPLTVRDNIIGVLEVRIPEKYNWSEEDINTLKRIVDQVSLALDNARLYQESWTRGTKEQVISEISSKIGASINIRNILQTAVEELGRALPGSDVEIRLEKTNKRDERG